MLELKNLIYFQQSHKTSSRRILSMEIRVSILTSCYRGIQYLPKYFDNVASQTLFQQLEIVFIHNEPSADELLLIRNFSAKYPNQIQHIKVKNQRTDFLHKISCRIIKSYSFIAVEDLDVKNMVQDHRLAKHISDVSWSRFIRLLHYKAVTSGAELVKVDPRGTSKICNECGTIVDMPLSGRKFKS